MNLTQTPLKDLYIIEPTVFEDDRGFFMESYNHGKFEALIGSPVNFVQDNHSKSSKNVLRGMHFQVKPYSQGKLVRCVSGEVYDVVVDLRKNSPTYKKWFGILLSAKNKKQLWIPEGFAHGFKVISESAEFLYKTTNYYSPNHERCLVWDDHTIGIEWPEIENVFLSEKDLKGKKFDDLTLEL